MDSSASRHPALFPNTNFETLFFIVAYPFKPDALEFLHNKK